MKNPLYSLIITLAILGTALGQSEPDNPAKASDQPTSAQTTSSQAPADELQPGSLIYVELNKSIDSKKAKVGDPVAAKAIQAVLSRGKLAIPKGSKIIGHLTAVKSHSKDQPGAELGIAFDRAELKDGTHVSLASAGIQAIGSVMTAQTYAQSSGNMDSSSDTGSMGSGGVSGGARTSGMPSPMAGPSYPPPRSGSPDADDRPASTSNSGLNANSHGVVGMPGVTLQNGTGGSKVVADKKNIKLDSGIEIILKTER
jgi:hypothetical protein